MDENKILKVLTEDIQSHRDYVQRLYRNAFSVGAVLVAVGIGLGYWILGKQLDAKIFEYRIVESYKHSLEERVKVAVANTVDSNEIQGNISTLIKDLSADEIRKASAGLDRDITSRIREEVEEIKELDIDKLIEKTIIPSASIMAFDLSECPNGWRAYKEAYGRFLRGIDKSNSGVDPEGKRSPSTLQDDQFAAHSHNIPHNLHVWDATGGLDSSTGRGRTFDIKSLQTTDSGSSVETRPKNVAVLFCVKI